MSTLNIDNYENHRPMTMIYQNLDIVSEGSADRTAAVLIGSQGKVHQYTTQPGLIQIRSQADINRLLRGGVDDDGKLKESDQTGNDLADCAEIALVAGGGDPFYCISTTVGDNENNWESAIRVLKNNDRTLFVCPLTADADKLLKVSSACLELSQADTQKWKRCYIGLEFDAFDYQGNLQRYQSLPKDTSDTFSSLYHKIVKKEEEKEETKYYLLYQDAACTKLLNSKTFIKNIENLGDLTDEENAESFAVYYKVDANIESLVYSQSNQFDVYYNLVTKLSENESQRACFVWSAGAKSTYATEDGVKTDGELTAQQLAAGVTALRASILPQQGLSRRSLSWAYAVPNAYIEYDTQSLNKIAVQGVFIITQDDPDSEVYIRHQLTNDLTRGILYYEDSVGVNVDTICYGLKDLVKPYIGQRNNTQETLVEIKNRVTDYLLGLTSSGVSIDARRIGPQIKEVDLESLIVKLDDNFKDRVVISVDIVVPVPLNQVHVHLNAFASLANTVESA